MKYLSTYAYDRGYQDYWNGILHNPYNKYDNRYYEWKQGYNDACDREGLMIESFFRNGSI